MTPAQIMDAGMASNTDPMGPMVAGAIEPCALMSRFELLRDYVSDPLVPEFMSFDVHDVAVAGASFWVFAQVNGALFAAPFGQEQTAIEPDAPGGWSGIVATSNEVALIKQNWTPYEQSEAEPAAYESLIYELSEDTASLLFRESSDTNELAEMPNGDLILAGVSYATTTGDGAILDGGAPDAGAAGENGSWLKRYDRMGNLVWSYPDSGVLPQYGTFGITVGPDGDVYWLTSIAEGDTFFLELHKIDENGQHQWSQRHDWLVNAGVMASPDGSVIVAGEAWPARLGVVRYDGDGTALFDDIFGTNGLTNDLPIAIDDDGTAFIPWYVGEDAYIYKFDVDNTLCVFSVGPRSIPAQIVASSGNLYFATDYAVGQIPY
jgi:hypothetical protein